jgi:hypothetical protein
MANPIYNRVSESGLVTLDLSEIIPNEEILSIDVKQFLFQEIVLKEQDFRHSLETFNWKKYQNKNVAIFCSTNAIIPTWAYMLLSTYLHPIANNLQFGYPEQMQNEIIRQTISLINTETYENKRVIIKGCSELRVTTFAYVEISKILLPKVKTLMYGEPCSTVPIYKKK